MKPEPIGSGFVYFCDIGLEPIQIRQSGGLSITAGLDGGNTLISSSPISSVIYMYRPPDWMAFLLLY